MKKKFLIALFGLFVNTLALAQQGPLSSRMASG